VVLAVWAGNVAKAEERFSLSGFGGAAAGQNLATVQRAFRDELVPTTARPDPECHYRQPRRLPGLQVMVENGVVARFDTKDPQYATQNGVRVGDTLERVKAAFGRGLLIAPHQVDPKGLLLAIYNTERTIGLVMEMHGGKVTQIRSGRVPAVDYVEGCPWN